MSETEKAVEVDVTDCEKRIVSEDAECGKIIKTQFFSADGTLVRQDVHVEVSEVYMAKMLAGLTRL